MTPVELHLEDLLGGDQPGGEPGGEPGSQVVEGDWIGEIKALVADIQASMDTFKSIIETIKGLQGQGQGQGQGSNIYKPPLSIGQQIAIVLNNARTMYGDVTFIQLLQLLGSQYGGLKLSQIIEFLKAQQ